MNTDIPQDLYLLTPAGAGSEGYLVVRRDTDGARART